MSAASSSPRPGTASIWWHAARPNTLPAALAGVIAGLGAAAGAGARFRPDTALAAALQRGAATVPGRVLTPDQPDFAFTVNLVAPERPR